MRFIEFLKEAVAVSVQDLEKVMTPEEKKKNRKKVGWVTDPKGILKYLQKIEASNG